MDKSGAIAAFFIGLVVYVSLEFQGFLILLTLHLIGAAVTRFGYNEKLKKGIAQKKRTFTNVAANGFIPGLAAILSSLSNTQSSLFFVAYVSTIAAATADTVSSEIGEISKKRPKLITTFEEVEVGTDGAISVLGTLSAIISAGLIALLAMFLNVKGVPLFNLFITVTIAGVAGTTVDSLLGATLERRGLIGNNTVNLLSLGISFVLSIFIYSVLF